MMKRFEGRGVLVTGAASGIGRATAERLLAEGAIVVGVDLAPEAPKELAGERFTYQEVDVLDADAVRTAVAAVVSGAGRLDGVVHAAGVAGGGPVHLLPHEEWDRVVGINLKGTFVVSRAALAQMVQQERVNGERGAIVNLASIEGIEGTVRWQRLQRVEGRRGAAHQEHRHRLRAEWDPGQPHLPGFHRNADVRLGDGHARLRVAAPRTPSRPPSRVGTQQMTEPNAGSQCHSATTYYVTATNEGQPSG
ncbi:MAG: hypothetical protein QOI01_1390 [Mycobacterium sp.]|jgi:NAD(P)-dependent dehydrogenase (short-subunit alcohol dehydrogenase family)|nr:hypothetical protein [Mycobacterium sp.]